MKRDWTFEKLTDLLEEIRKMTSTLFMVHTDGETICLYDTKRSKCIFMYDCSKFTHFVSAVNQFSNDIATAGCAKFHLHPKASDAYAINRLEKIYGKKYINDFL